MTSADPLYGDAYAHAPSGSATATTLDMTDEEKAAAREREALREREGVGFARALREDER